MDYLDGNLHQSILTALASNLASTSSRSDDNVALLTDSFSHVAPYEPVTNGAVNGLLSRLSGSNGARDETTTTVVTQPQIESMISFAQYAALSSASSSDHNLGQLLHLLRAVPGWSVEPTLGSQASQDYAPSDILAHALLHAALTLVFSTTSRDSLTASRRTETIQALAQFQKDIVEEIERAEEGHRIISHLLPALNGSRRAVSSNSATFAFSLTDAATTHLTAPPQSVSTTVRETLAHDWDLSSPPSATGAGGGEGRVALATMRLYDATSDDTGRGLSAGMLTLADLETRLALWTGAAMSRTSPSSSGTKARDWTRSAPVQPQLGGVAQAEENRDYALDVWRRTIRELENVGTGAEGGEVGIDAWSWEILRASLKLATVTTIALAQTPPAESELLKTLDGLLAQHPATVSDEGLQICAVDCVQALGFAFPAMYTRATATIRRFILTPSPLFLEQAVDLGPSKALKAAVQSYALLIDLSGDRALRESAVQSLFTHFSAVGGLSRLGGNKSSLSVNANANANANSDARSVRSFAGTLADPLLKGVVSSNVAHAVGALAVAFNDQELARLVASMLLQRLPVSGGGDSMVDGAVMYALAQIVSLLDDRTFEDVVKRVYDVSKGVPSESDLSSVVLTAMTKLAEAAAKRPDFHLPFLIETLELAVHKGMHESSFSSTDRNYSKSARSDSLLELLPIIDTFLTSANFDPKRQDLQPAVMGLFRNLWYLCTLSGFMSTPARIAEWQKAALVRIARRSPTLLRGVGTNFVETELDYNGILKSSSHALSTDAIRGELAAAVPQQATNARSLPAQQVVFLTTVLRLESLRAESGRPASMLEYFHVEGINSHPALYETLSSIADKVNSHFIRHLSGQVTSHSMDPVVYHEIREIIIECGHQFSKTRTVALRYLNDLVSSFPSLLCHQVVITALLEMLTLLRRSCLSEFTDEYTPTYKFHSDRAQFTITLADDYAVRNKILSDLHRYTRSWLKAAITRAPLEVRNLLQEYVDEMSVETHATVFADDEMGKSVAIDIVRMSPTNSSSNALPNWGDWRADESAQFARSYAAKRFYGGQASKTADVDREDILDDLDDLAESMDKHKFRFKLADLRQLFYRAAGHLIKAQNPDVEILDHVVSLPVRMFTEASTSLAQEVWTWIADSRPELESRLMIEVVQAWTTTIANRQGLFSQEVGRGNPLNQETQFTPTDKDSMTKDYHAATKLLQPHLTLLAFLSSRFQAFRYHNSNLVLSCLLLVMRSVAAAKLWNSHPLARELRMRLVSFGFCVLQGSQLESVLEYNLRAGLYDAALAWFAEAPTWSYGSNRVQLKTDLQAVEELVTAVKSDSPSYSYIATSTANRAGALPGRISLASARAVHKNRSQLLIALLENECDRLKLWLNPLLDSKHGPLPSKMSVSEGTWKQLARIAWSQWPDVAVQLPARIKHPAVTAEVTRLVQSNPVRVQHNADALAYFIGEKITADVRPHLRHLLFWAPVPVVFALRFLFPKFGGDAVLLQYALRVLEHHPVEVTFFYIPQVVQALRSDDLGYAERFIFETSQISQLFCHQIIWNMKANAFRGDDGEEPDPMKPTLDRMIEMISGALDGEAKEFYQREFAFFDEVTSISAKLKPYIKSPKPEKKAKIDEEMAKIKVDPGVYLPSNPDGVVVDINRLSGRPLQSHAKAPFMATFKVRREHKGAKNIDLATEDAQLDSQDPAHPPEKTFDTWQSAIFKVGDDCRQDVLALQIIAMAKNVFTSVGLDLLVTPYKVTATGPGCGVIDVIPDSTSRDEMGRAKINDLKSFFLVKYGSADTIEFQQARNNFIQSMAAYSLLCYLVQIKDRHNGNIMIDGRGCITHIDFGFLFDIGPGGVKFEPSSFKLTHEMIVLMGGKDSVGFRHFTELTVKSFLACRPYGLAIVETSTLMAQAGFPSYKDDQTMQRLTDRFRLDLNEVEAAEYMMGVVNNALENPRSIVYDEFQRMTNGIPYVR